MTTWVLVWYLMIPGNVQPLRNVPARSFATRDECQSFGHLSAAAVQIYRGGNFPVRFECKKGLLI
jgi:hypothetical protein